MGKTSNWHAACCVWSVIPSRKHGFMGHGMWVESLWKDIVSVTCRTWRVIINMRKRNADWKKLNMSLWKTEYLKIRKIKKNVDVCKGIFDGYFLIFNIHLHNVPRWGLRWLGQVLLSSDEADGHDYWVPLNERPVVYAWTEVWGSRTHFKFDIASGVRCIAYPCGWRGVER